MTADPSDTDRAPRPYGALAWLLAVAVLAAAAWGGWTLWQRHLAASAQAAELSPEALDARLLALEQATTALRRAQQSLDQRLADTTARTGVLRDEVLGVSQRAAILEDNLRELAAEERDGRDTLRLDEAELLLSLAETRLQVAGDRDGAVRAAELARAALSSLTDPQWVNLRQTLEQELATLRALPADPRRQAAGELAALEATLPSLANRAPGEPATTAPDASRWQRLLDAVVQVRPSGAHDLLSPADRATGEAALYLELALARGALERRDEAAFRAGLARIDQWLQRLYADGPALAERRERLAALAGLPLAGEAATLGTSLAQLRELRRQWSARR